MTLKLRPRLLYFFRGETSRIIRDNRKLHDVDFREQSFLGEVRRTRRIGRSNATDEITVLMRYALFSKSPSLEIHDDKLLRTYLPIYCETNRYNGEQITVSRTDTIIVFLFTALGRFRRSIVRSSIVRGGGSHRARNQRP